MSVPITIEFEMTDDLAARATSENWIAHGRRLFTPGLLAITAASAAVLALSLRKDPSLPWLLLAGTAPALLVVMLIIWVAGLVWMPRVAQKKLVRLVVASGSEIPLPREVVSAETKAWLQAKVGATKGRA